MVEIGSCARLRRQRYRLSDVSGDDRGFFPLTKGENDMSEINDELREKLTKALEKGLTDNALKTLKKHIDDLRYEIETDIFYRLKYELAPNLSSYVVEMAGRTVDAILQGNQKEMERYLGCEEGAWTGRSDSPQYGRQREDHEWQPVIHGKLFEQGSMKLRRDIVEAHRDLITDQRILDLEDQVKSLVAQVNKAKADKEAMWERVRACE